MMIVTSNEASRPTAEAAYPSAQWYVPFEPTIPMNIVACNNFTRASYAV